MSVWRKFLYKSDEKQHFGFSKQCFQIQTSGLIEWILCSFDWVAVKHLKILKVEKIECQNT